jgi:hypothetical protein
MEKEVGKDATLNKQGVGMINWGENVVLILRFASGRKLVLSSRSGNGVDFNKFCSKAML